MSETGFLALFGYRCLTLPTTQLILVVGMSAVFSHGMLNLVQSEGSFRGHKLAVSTFSSLNIKLSKANGRSWSVCLACKRTRQYRVCVANWCKKRKDYTFLKCWVMFLNVQDVSKTLCPVHSFSSASSNVTCTWHYPAPTLSHSLIMKG